MNEVIPQYLYHYTNIDSLALILKNKTIRLNSLDKMDDLQEQMSQDKQNFGKFIFVSSWTDDETESIPMWRMYTPKQRGVRIKLPTNPFVEYQATAQEIEKTFGIPVLADKNTPAPFKTIVPFEELFSGDFSIANYGIGNQLIKVEYVDEENLLNPTLVENKSDGSIGIALGDLGKYKNKYWKFQREWRYKLMFYPASVKKMAVEHFKGQNIEIATLFQNIIKGQATLPFNHYDLSVKKESFEDMTIMLAPDISDSSKTFVELLVKEFNPKCKIETSALSNLIR